jgi:hypothetical protein
MDTVVRRNISSPSTTTTTTTTTDDDDDDNNNLYRRGAYLSIGYIFMAWYLVKQRDGFILTLPYLQL